MNEKDLELLGLLQEECAEVIQIVSKIRRFGLDSYNPYEPEKGNNQTLFEHEVGDVFLIIDLLKERGLLHDDAINDRMIWKRVKLEEGGIIPKRKSMVEFLMEPGNNPFLEDDVWDWIERDRRLNNISCDIKEELQHPTTSDPDNRRKYLLRQAAAIYAELETLSESEKENED